MLKNHLIRSFNFIINVSITGHSLGGALATLFGFYVGAKPMFSHLSRVYIWTYAAPRVGCNVSLEDQYYFHFVFEVH